MNRLIPILVMLLLVGCNSTLKPLSEQSDFTVETERKGIIHHEHYQRGVPILPRIPSQQEQQSQLQPELPSQPIKDEQVQIQQRKNTGYKATIDPATGKIIIYPVYEDEKK